MKEKNKKIIFIIIGIIIILLISIFLLYKININKGPKELTSFYFENYKSELGVGETTKLDIPSTIDSKNIKYKSSDETIAIVDNNGNVTALSEGNVTISATTEKYKAEANINIITSTSNTQVTSKPPYKKINKDSFLGVIDLTNIEPFIRVHTPRLNTPQGMCVTDKYVIVTGKGSYVSVKVYDKNNPDKKAITKHSDSLGHANGLTYVKNEDTIYVADGGGKDDETGTNHNNRYYKVSIKDNNSIIISTNNTYGFNFTNKDGKLDFGGLAYDNTNKIMYLSNGNTIKAYDINNKTITKTIYRRFIKKETIGPEDGKKERIDYGTQDIAYYNEKILSIRYKSDNYGSAINYGTPQTKGQPQTARNAIDIYSTTRNGMNAFLGSFMVKTKKTISGYNDGKLINNYNVDDNNNNYELESIDVDETYLYLYFNLLLEKKYKNLSIDKNGNQILNATHDVYRIELKNLKLNSLK